MEGERTALRWKREHQPRARGTQAADAPAGDRPAVDADARGWWRWHAELCARIKRVTRTDWEVSISYGHRSTTFYEVTRQFRNDQAAKAFADNAVRRVIKHHCDFACCGEWTISPL